MKKISFLLLLIIILTTVVFCQNYKPFDFVNGNWICYYNTKGGVFYSTGNIYVDEKVKFFCPGDTTITGTVFKKLYYSGYAKPSGSQSISISGYYGAIRNDTVNKRVWIIYKNTTYNDRNPFNREYNRYGCRLQRQLQNSNTNP